ncbi:hypothetical protein QTP88_009389 [Uroleucon formosanum]
MSNFFELFNVKKKPNETAKSESVLPTEIPEKSTVHPDSSSNIDFDFRIQISDINDLGNINSGPSRPIMKENFPLNHRKSPGCLYNFQEAQNNTYIHIIISIT